MKKIAKATGLILAAALALSIAACSPPSDESEFAGTWKVSDTSGAPFEIVLTGDGNASADRSGEALTGTWKEEGGGAVITWSEGWMTKIAKDGAGYKKTAYEGDAEKSSSAAEKVKASNPDVIPINVYSGKTAGEAASMQGLEMLMYGTEDTLYDTDSKKWVVGSQGFKDSLQFVSDVYQGGLGPSLQQALDPNIFTSVTADWLPSSKLAIALDGSWQSAAWVEGGTAAWPEWSDALSIAAMPTQDGQAPGTTSMSGGWTLAIGKNTKNADAAWDFLSTAVNKDNATAYGIDNSQIAVRADVAQSSEYLDANPSFKTFSSFVDTTHFRPATEDYDKISNQIQVAMEAVMTGQSSVDDAAAAYDQAVIGIVGEDNTQQG